MFAEHHGCISCGDGRYGPSCGGQSCADAIDGVLEEIGFSNYPQRFFVCDCQGSWGSYGDLVKALNTGGMKNLTANKTTFIIIPMYIQYHKDKVLVEMLGAVMDLVMRGLMPIMPPSGVHFNYYNFGLHSLMLKNIMHDRVRKIVGRE